MTIGRMDIVIPGAGPYGFRLAGGDGRPLTVTKLRRQSKACGAGLHEGDYLLGINGFECRTMSHSSAMALLENAVDSISLSVFRGAASQLDNAFDAAASSLRPLSPSSLPPPRLLPPPPAAALSSTGDLVIDQPSFLRQNWPQQKLATAGSDQPAICVCPPGISVAPPLPPAPLMPPRQFAAVAEPRVIDACPPQPLPPSDAVLPTFRVKPFSGEGKQWTPFHQQHAPAPPPAPFQPQQPASSPSGHASHTLPTKWKPTETPILVRAHAEVHPEPEPEPETVGTTTTWSTSPMGRVSVRLDRVEGPSNDVEAVPRWALPLRAEYDWKEAYHWGDSDEWEITDDGQYFIRKKKIFADSSFYDEPEHKYPTIEEQIKMARKVAQSLMSPGNVKARGQRMFLRRREKADHCASDTLGPRPGLRRPASVRAAAVEHFESDAELPAPGSVQRSPWHQAEAGAPSWTPKATDTSPTSGSKWRPVHHVEPSRPMPKQFGTVPPQVAFGLAKDLTRMQDKGGRMFAKRRARAAVEETEDYASEAVQAARTDVMRRIADSYVPPASATRHDVPDSTVEQTAPSATRLVEMIERSRATSGGPGGATHPASGGRDTTRTVTFTTTRTQAGFRPVRFKAPLVVTAADIAVAEQLETEGISDF